MSKYSRGQQAQITKRVRLRGSHPFTSRDKKCVICGLRTTNGSCVHSIEENQEAIEEFSAQVDTD